MSTLPWETASANAVRSRPSLRRHRAADAASMRRVPPFARHGTEHERERDIRQVPVDLPFLQWANRGLRRLVPAMYLARARQRQGADVDYGASGCRDFFCPP